MLHDVFVVIVVVWALTMVWLWAVFTVHLLRPEDETDRVCAEIDRQIDAARVRHPSRLPARGIEDDPGWSDWAWKEGN